jgi:carboxylate-amine ligase
VDDEVQFAESAPLTVGVEEELLLVERRGVAPACVADRVLGGSWDTIAVPGGWLKSELLRCTVEATTAASDDLEQLHVDLEAVRAEVVARAGAAGARAIGVGLHPDLVVEDPLVTPSPAHRRIAALYERVGALEVQSTHGIHVHVGMPSLADAVRVTSALAGLVPLFIACSAWSPVERGEPSSWRSARSEHRRCTPWAGPTPQLAGANEYVAIHRLHQLESASPQRFVWDVAPVPALGTVEVRAFDAQPDARMTIAYAALVQGIAAHVLDGGARIVRPHGSIERHNRWSATQYGMAARFLVPGRDEPIGAIHVLAEVLDVAADALGPLGGAAWLAPLQALVEADGAHPSDALLDAFEAGGVDALPEVALVSSSGAPDRGGA